MRTRNDPAPGLLRLADRQSGVLTTRQARTYGLGRHSVERLISDGSWQRLAPGLYAVGRDRSPWLAWAWGGVLLGGDGARLGGQAAAYVHRLVDQPPARILVWTRRAEQHQSRRPWEFRRQLDGVRRPGRDRPPVISIEDTVLDLCAGATEQEVIHLVTRAVQHRLTRPWFLRLRIEERGRVSHSRLLSELLADVSAGAETPLELAYLRDVERAHRLPRGARQHRDRRSGHYRDVWYEEWHAVVELDGRLGHEGIGRFRDMSLDNLGVMDGTSTLRFGWHDVRGRPCEVARQVETVLRRNGWSGRIGTCGRCGSDGELVPVSPGTTSPQGPGV